MEGRRSLKRRLDSCTSESRDSLGLQFPIRSSGSVQTQYCESGSDGRKPNARGAELELDEVDLIIRMHNLLGDRWELIAGRLPGRTANDVKNYWDTHIKGRHVSAPNGTNTIENYSSSPTTIFKPRPRTLSRNSAQMRSRMSANYIHTEEVDSQPFTTTKSTFLQP